MRACTVAKKFSSHIKNVFIVIVGKFSLFLLSSFRVLKAKRAIQETKEPKARGYVKYYLPAVSKSKCMWALAGDW